MLKETLTGRGLNRKWNVNARHALYHKDGTWYEVLKHFPGALFDPDGYVFFKTEEEYKRSPHLRVALKTNVRNSIKSIPGYRKMR